jgi:hypothetical protein
VRLATFLLACSAATLIHCGSEAPLSPIDMSTMDLSASVDLSMNMSMDLSASVDLSMNMSMDLSASVDGSFDMVGDLWTVDESSDGPSVDMAKPVIVTCNAYLSCLGTSVILGWDPCQPLRCSNQTNGFCVPLSGSSYAAPDGTPCDDGDACTFATPSTCSADADCPNGGTPSCVGGDRDGQSCTTDDDCTPNRAGPCRPTCSGGSKAGQTCNLDSDCPGVSKGCTVATKKCNSGTNKGNNCTTNSDCDLSYDYSGEGLSGCNGYCVQGPPYIATTPTTVCINDADCGGAGHFCCPYSMDASNPCNNFQFPVCNGGLFNGNTCYSPSDCAAAKCVKWSCDTTNHDCIAQNGIPSCKNGQADCDLTPYNKYCFLDPDYYQNAWVPGSLADPNCGSDGKACPNTCKGGTGDYGPVVSYTCNTTTHQCLGASVPCGGGSKGAGSVCNNVCRSGRCASDYSCH